MALTYPVTLVSGDNEDVNDLNSILNAIKTWGNGNIATNDLLDGSITAAKAAASLQQLIFQTGDIKVSARTTAPVGWLLFAGQQNLAKATYADLWALAQTEIAAGNTLYNTVNATYFGIADLRGRALMAAGAGAGLTSRALGVKLGEENHTLLEAEMPGHSHGVIDPGHTHIVGSSSRIINLDNGALWGGPADIPGFKEVVMGADRSFTGIGTQNAGSGSTHNNMQPSAAINVLLKT